TIGTTEIVRLQGRTATNHTRQRGMGSWGWDNVAISTLSNCSLGSPRHKRPLGQVEDQVHAPAEQAGDDEANEHLPDTQDLVILPDDIADALAGRQELRAHYHNQREPERESHAGKDGGKASRQS